eukprot:2187762-Ditylum_brightwellii.AAC.1
MLGQCPEATFKTDTLAGCTNLVTAKTSFNLSINFLMKAKDKMSTVRYFDAARVIDANESEGVKHLEEGRKEGRKEGG